MIVVQVEKYADVIDEIKPLLALHWQEIANNRDAIPLDPNYAHYKVMEDAGMLVILAARKDDALVGYSIFFLLRNLHYQSTLFAMNDVLYLLPAERASRVGLRLIKESERVVASMGAKKISWHIKPTHDFSPLLERLGYAKDEIAMGKIISGD